MVSHAQLASGCVDGSQTSYAKDAVLVRGVLSPGSASRWERSDRGLDKIESLVLLAWRIGDGEVKRQRLGVRSAAQVSEDSWTHVRLAPTSLYRSFGVVEIEVRLSACQKRALYVGNLVPAVDAELQHIARELASPLVVPTDFVGDLTRTRGGAQNFVSEAEWLGSPVQVEVAADGDVPAESAMELGAALWADQETVTRDVKALLAKAHHRSADSEIAGAISLRDLKLWTISIRQAGWYAFEFLDETDHTCGALVLGRHDEGPTSVRFKY